MANKTGYPDAERAFGTAVEDSDEFPHPHDTMAAWLQEQLSVSPDSDAKRTKTEESE